MSRSAAPPNAGRAVPVPAVYHAFFAEVERNRLRFGVPMWQVDEAAGTQAGYYAHALYASTPSGRIATWSSVQMILEALFPQGFSLKIEPSKGGCLTADKHRLAIRFSGARYDFEARGDWMRELAPRGGKKGGPARARKLSKRRRRAIAKHAAKKRWNTPKITEITDASTGT